MPRLPRVQLEGAVYLVSCRGSSQEGLFRSPQDHDAYLKLLREYKEKYGFKLFAYCLLPDQVMLCLEIPPQAAISNIMHDLTTRYTKYFNKQYSREGHLFQQRFNMTVAEKAAYLAKITAYLHTRAMRLGLSKEIAGYPFDSYRYYTASFNERVHMDISVEVKEVIDSFSSKGEVSYEKYVSEFLAKESGPVESELRHRIIGSDDFIQTVKSKIEASKQTKLSAEEEVPVLADKETKVSRSQKLVNLKPALVGVFSVALVGACTIYVISMRKSPIMQQIAKVPRQIMSFRENPVASIRTSSEPLLTSLEGTSWDIWLAPLDAGTKAEVRQDEISFGKTKLISDVLRKEGAQSSTYHIAYSDGGTSVWETIQVLPTGETVDWKGEFSGGAMKGVVARQAVGKQAQRFSFVGVLRDAQKIRSEI